MCERDIERWRDGEIERGREEKREEEREKRTLKRDRVE
jgi:hypothetical protein